MATFFAREQRKNRRLLDLSKPTNNFQETNLLETSLNNIAKFGDSCNLEGKKNSSLFRMYVRGTLLLIFLLLLSDNWVAGYIAGLLFKSPFMHPRLNFQSPRLNFQRGKRQARQVTVASASFENSLREGQFDWESQWYPLSPLRDLDKKVPNQVKLLSMDLVVWYHYSTATWQIFQDRCPHRLAPLSEGRIDMNGNLQVIL